MQTHDDGINPRYKTIILRAMEYHFPSARIILFGSRATGTHKPGSDIDITVDAGQKVDLHALQRARITMENTIIPLTVDIVDLNRVPKELHDVIIEKGTLWKN